MKDVMQSSHLSSSMRGLALAVTLIATLSALPSWGAVGFVPNCGRFPSEVLYQASWAGADVFILNQSLVIQLKSEPLVSGPPNPVVSFPWIERYHRSLANLRIEFDAPKGSCEIEAHELAGGQLNFIRDGDPSSWASDVRTARRIIIRGIQPSLDLELSFEDCGLRYRFLGQSHHRRTAPRVDMDGFTHHFDPDTNESQFRCALGTIRTCLTSAKTDCGFIQWKLTSNPVDSGEPVRDDSQALSWSTFLGGSDFERPHALCRDEAGFLFVAGATTSPEFPVTPGVVDSVRVLSEAFVAKFDPAAQQLIWCTYLGGSDDDWGHTVDLDTSGNIVVSGTTYSHDFPLSDNAFDQVASATEGFIAKISGEGSTLLHSTLIGGSGMDFIRDIDLDDAGNPVATGYTTSFNFPVTPEAYDPTPDFTGPMDLDVFVAKLSSTYSNMHWGTYVSGDGIDVGHEVVLDHIGRPIVVGSVGSYGFPSTPGSFDESNNLKSDGFALRLSSDGAKLEWATFLGGSEHDSALDLHLGEDDSPVILGLTESNDFPVSAGCYDDTWNGDSDFFLFSLSVDGSAMTWSTFLGGAGEENTWGGLVLLPDGSYGFAGFTESADFPTSDGAYDSMLAGESDAILSVISSMGSELVWSSYLGTPEIELGTHVAAAEDGLVLTGYTYSSLFPATPGSYDSSFNGTADVFLAKFDVGLATTAPELTPTNHDDLQLACHPNPFNPTVRGSFILASPSRVCAFVHDAMGRNLACVFDEFLGTGRHGFEWDGKDSNGRELPSGMYFLDLRAGGLSSSARLTLLK